MIVLPQGWKRRPVGKEVVIAWSPSAQATRVVHDALPILARARKVTVFAFDPPADAEDADLEMLREHLLAHGSSPTGSRSTSTGGRMPAT